MKNNHVLAALALSISFHASAQVGNGAVPAALRLGLDRDALPTAAAATFDAVRVAEEMSGADQRLKMPSYARFLALRDGGLQNGSWTELPNGDRVWRLRVTSPGALATELHFSTFDIPEGAALFVYTEDGSEVLGGYERSTVQPDGTFSTGLLSGPTCIVEYDEPAAVAGQGHLVIDEVGHAYRMAGAEDGARADFCEVDVNCSEGSGWAEQRDATVRISVRLGSDNYWCSGTLVNNLAQDCKPYFLTAKHCGTYPNGNDATVADYNQWRFYFRYQRNNCASGSAPSGYSMLGCTERGDSEDGGGESGSDFLLLEANTATIPSNYNPYWAGWDATTATSTGGKGIHHPAGSEKKISTFTGTTVSASWGASGTHWRIIWVETANGHGVTEGGSSGSALFDNDHRIIGTLTGGLSCCAVNDCGGGTGPDQPDFYGKMSQHWTGNPNGLTDKLKNWLDPASTGTLMMDGSYAPCASIGLDESGNPGFFLIQPNPATDRLTLIHPEGIPMERIELLDVAGRRLATTTPALGDRTVIELSGQAPGVYLIRVRTQQGDDLVQRIVVQAK